MGIQPQRSKGRKPQVPHMDVRNNVIIIGNACRSVVLQSRGGEPREVGLCMRGGHPTTHTTTQRAFGGDVILKAELMAGDRSYRLSAARVESDPARADRLQLVPVCSPQDTLKKCSPELVAWLEGVTATPAPGEGLLPVGCGWDGKTTAAMRAVVGKLRKFLTGVHRDIAATFEAEADNSRGLGKKLNWTQSDGTPVTRLKPQLTGLKPMVDKTKPFDVVILYDNNQRPTVIYPETSTIDVPEFAMRAAVFTVNCRQFRGEYTGLDVKLYSRRRDVSKLKN